MGAKKMASKEEGFTTLQLRNKIASAPIFKDIGQHPVCSERGKKQSLFKLKIKPLPMERMSIDMEDSQGHRQDPVHQFFLDLQFCYTKLPNQDHISHLTKNLCGLADVLPLNQVSWKSLASEDSEMQKQRRHVKKWQFLAKRGSVSRKLKFPRLEVSPSSGGMEAPATPQSL